MAPVNNSNKKNTTQKKPAARKRSSTGTRRSRSRKTKLDTSKLSLFLGILFLIICVCVAVNVLSVSNNDSKESRKQTVTAAKTAAPAASKKTETSEKTFSWEKKSSSGTSSKSAASPKAPSKTSSSVTVKPDAPSSASNSSKTQSSQTKTAVTPAAPAKTETPKVQPQVQLKPSAPVASAKGDTGNSNTAVKPKVSVPQEKPFPFTIPQAKNGATLVIIIDDAGLNVSNTKKYTALPFPLTIAVLPKLSHTKDCAYAVRSSGKELILHQPMQSLNHNLNPGPGKITVDMSFAEISSIVNENLAELGPGVKGINNHEGSEVTEDVLRIGAVLDVCLENKIYFLDSRTTANTKAPQAALERDMKIFEKAGPYIDNVVSREAMLKEMYKALDFANKNGKAIIIGHVDKSANILPALLSDMYPYLIKAGYRFATPSTL